MRTGIRRVGVVTGLVVVMCLAVASVQAQRAAATPGRGGGAPAGPVVMSPEVQADRRVTFRLVAPEASAVTVSVRNTPMTKTADGVWEATVGPLDPGTYRYTFQIGGVRVVDPRNPAISESRDNVSSLLYVPGLDFMDTQDVPHGTVAVVNYYSTSLKKMRRMHVYTPPGYEGGSARSPIFYLLHGAGDSDDSWTSVGRAQYILDNLIAAKKAKPMVVVMPAGHTSQTLPGPAGGRGTGGGGGGVSDPFIDDFVHDVMPYAETHYRVYTDRAHRAIAGLSMGGSQTLSIGFSNLPKFSAIGVFSSGVIGGGRGAAPAGTSAEPARFAEAWETQHQAGLDDSAARSGLKVLWFSTGVDDGLMPTTKGTVELLKKHGFSPVFKESPGAHTWINWQTYLSQYAPLLFQ